MKKESNNSDMLPEYDFSAGRRGRFHGQYMSGTNIVRLDPDVAREFPTSESVNSALRELISSRKKPRKR